MNLLVCNDDGIRARGIDALAAALEPIGTVWVVAPESERSAQSHALTLHKPLRATPRGERRWAVSGTPADCVYLAVHHLMPEAPRLVLSGINRGANLGNDVFYSGTVAAAMEACLHGLPAVALSLYHQPDDEVLHWETAARVGERVARAAIDSGLPPRVLLNVNVPNVPLASLRGLAAASLGQRHYEPLVTLRQDPRGREYFWIGGDHIEFEPIEGSDGPLCEQGYATVTPIHPDFTFRSYLDDVRAWTDV